MGERLRALALLVVLLGAGILLGSSLAQWWNILPPLPGGASSGQIQDRVRVEVLNAGGTPGVARDATAALRDRGLDVVYYGNAENFTEEPSVVLDRVGRSDVARTVADALGIRAVVLEPDSNLFVDVTVRLGPEWALEEEPIGTRAPSWWDLRRYLRKRDNP
ncbi:MAG: LytR C-terminal domain-containing protein [Longimicrobiales bacterium]